MSVNVVQRASETALAYLAIVLIPILPRSCVMLLARLIGGLTLRASARDRNVGMANLDVVYGDTITIERKREILRKAASNFTLLLLDYYWFSFRTARRLEKWVDIDDAAASLSSDRATVLCSGHLGNWEVIGTALALRGHIMLSVAKPLKNPNVDRLLIRSREKTGQTIVQRSGAMKGILGAIKANGVIGLLLDQNTLPEEGGRFVPFFDRPVPMSSILDTLARRDNVAIASASSIPDSRGRYRVEFALLENREDATQAMAQRIQDLILKYPEHWMWAYKRWKFCPEEDMLPEYPFYSRIYKDPKAKETDA